MSDRFWLLDEEQELQSWLEESDFDELNFTLGGRNPAENRKKPKDRDLCSGSRNRGTGGWQLWSLQLDSGGD